MENLFISLPIELASNELLNSITSERESSYTLVCYSARMDIIGFSSIYYPLDIETICKSEEEFRTKVNQAKLMRIL